MGDKEMPNKFKKIKTISCITPSQQDNRRNHRNSWRRSITLPGKVIKSNQKFKTSENQMKMKANLPESLGYSKDSSKKKVSSYEYLVFKNYISSKLINLVVIKFFKKGKRKKTSLADKT